MGRGGSVANSIGNALDKGKGIALEKSKINALDKGKGVATGSETACGNVGSEASRGREAPAPALEINLLPMLNAGDAAPYFDDPIHEDELDTALRDADYEGDEIYVSRIFKNVKDYRMKLAIHAINRKFHFLLQNLVQTSYLLFALGMVTLGESTAAKWTTVFVAELKLPYSNIHVA